MVVFHTLDSVILAKCARKVDFIGVLCDLKKYGGTSTSKDTSRATVRCD